MSETGAEAAERAAQAAGIPTEEPVYEDYFGFDRTEKWFFPDQKQYIEFRIMDEGARSRFQKLTSQDIKVKRATGDASIKADPAEERHALITSSVVGWHIFHQGKEVPFSSGSPGAEFERWLSKADPKLIDELEYAIRLANPWLQDAMTTEAIDKEIDRLTDLRKTVEEREMEKARSSTR